MLTAIARMIALLLSLSAIPAGIGWTLGDARGSAIGALLGLALFIFLGLTSEWMIVRRLGGRPARSKALKFTFARAWDGRTRPRMAIFPDAVPSCFVVRGISGPGTILLSQGLLNVLDEEELRGMIRAAAFRSADPSLILNSVCGWLAHVLNPFPGKLRMSAWSAAGFILRYPLMRYFLGLSSARPNSGLAGEDFSGALRKIARVRGTFGAGARAHAAGSGLVYLSVEG